MTDYGTAHFRNAWKIFKSCPRVFVTSMLVLLASWVGLELAVFALHSLGILVWLILHLLFLLLFSGLMAGFHVTALRAADGHSPNLALLTASLRRGPAVLLAFCIYSAAVLCGLILFVIPGIYVAVKYSFFVYVLAAEPVSALEALRRAAALSRGRWWTVFRFVLMALLLNLGGAALFGLGLVITFPVSLLAGSGLFLCLERSLRLQAGGTPGIATAVRSSSDPDSIYMI
jgi:hypothetical protein